MERSEIDAAYLKRCIRTLEQAFDQLRRHDPDDILYDIYRIYRAACVKEFELVLEQSGKLLKKRLRPWVASNRQADRLTTKDVFRHAAKPSLVPADACERGLEYRDNRNDTVHDYGAGFAVATSARQRLPAQALSQFLCPVPMEQLARAFEKIVRPLIARATEAVQECRRLARLRDALLPRLVSGELRIQPSMVQPRD